ncbi:MAG: adenylate/guanylate cyclase domain-containing protein [Zetaproteobacteria bacterium]|nr:adenylate/guanylate cyclase domain-containing protein [Zetaproteobacteria bacterium]
MLKWMRIRRGLLWIGAHLANLMTSSTGYAKQSEYLKFHPHFNHNINPEVRYILEQHPLSLDEVRSIPSEHWIAPTSDNISFQLKKSVLWVQLRVLNEDEPTQAYIDFNPIILENIKIFDTDGCLIGQSGSLFGDNILASKPTLEVPLAHGKNSYWVRIEGRSNSLSIGLKSRAEFLHSQRVDIGIYAMIMGAMIILLIYHLFLFLRYDDRTLILYVFFLSCAAMFTTSFTAFAYTLLPTHIWGFPFGFWWSALFASLMCISLYVFSWSFLKLSQDSYAWLMHILPLSSIVAILGILLTQNVLWIAVVRLLSLFYMLALPMYSFLKYLKTKMPSELIYTLSWLPFSAGVFAVVFWLAGFYENEALLAWSIPSGTLIQSLLLSFSSGEKLNNLSKSRTRDLEMIKSFSSTEIVDELARGDDPRSFKPIYEETNVVFFDMRNFTTFSESMAPLDLYMKLNEYFIALIQITNQYGGKTEKIIGDAVMCKFANSQNCLQAILEIRKRFSKLNRSLIRSDGQPFKFGTGITRGKLLKANFGSIEKLDRTLFGDVVNTAQRVENMTKELKVDVLCTRDYVEELEGYPHCRPAGYIGLKGKTKKMLLYEIFGHNSAKVIAWKTYTKTFFEQIVELELSGQYQACFAILDQLQQECPAHSFIEGEILDPTLESIRRAILIKLKTLDVS